MKTRKDLVTARSPKGLEVVQITTEKTVPSSHLYMEAQVFTPDSKRFVLHRGATSHGTDCRHPDHQYLVCDLQDRCRLTPLTTEIGATAAAISPDGKSVYYFVDETLVNGGRLILKRVRLDGTDRETLYVLDGPIPDTSFRPSRPYPLSTISSDGLRLAISAFLGNGKTENAPWGLLVFDIRQNSVRLVIHGQTWCNMHPQYSRALEPEAAHDILIQENHGNVCDATGKIIKLVSGHGADIHVLRDDGAGLRDLPWGRDGNEFCQGHQCWRGRSSRAITSTTNRQRKEGQLIESIPVPHAGHLGIKTPGGSRNDLSRNYPQPDFSHFATDIQGRRLISDAEDNQGGAIYLADLPASDTGPLENITFLLYARSACLDNAHVHPFLSPDGTLGFFNSNESGMAQAYMVRGW